jgi:hypothetical protein
MEREDQISKENDFFNKGVASPGDHLRIGEPVFKPMDSAFLLQMERNRFIPS